LQEITKITINERNKIKDIDFVFFILLIYNLQMYSALAQSKI
jgi:hypothetical protein